MPDKVLDAVGLAVVGEVLRGYTDSKIEEAIGQIVALLDEINGEVV